jgi:hypothetical protein
MRKISRRDFLKAAAAGAGAITLSTFLDACGKVIPLSFPSLEESTSTPQQSTPGSSSPRVTRTSEGSPTATGTVPSPTDTPLPLPDMVVTRGGEPEILVRKALEALGGMDKFVFSGANVIIKPNICTANHSYEYASTTNPWVVGTLVKMCFEAGAASV